MKSTLFLFFFSLLVYSAWAQPVNDNCAGLIDLGVIPACNASNIYTNVDATASNIGFGNNPSCFNGGNPNRDVWFAFTVGTDFTDVTVSLSGSTAGANGSILNPQIAIYRGSCEVDGLAELACVSAPVGAAQVSLDILGLTPGVTYFLRINDYSASAAPNWGDFTLCVDEYVPAINIGSSPGSSACFGTLYDSGGPDNGYSAGENHTFTICPADFHNCIIIDLISFATENGLDRINFYGGSNTSAPLIATATGIDNGQAFEIFATSQCVTVQFISDGSVQADGFELTWSCSPLECGGSTPDNPTVVDVIPFNETDFTTCGAGATFASSPCGQDAFLGGPEYVFAYQSPGNICASITITGAEPGTGVIVLDGPPSDPNTLCVATSANGVINSANFEEEGLYYIVVANAQGCTDFGINIQPTECILSGALVDALCNPLNGCIEDGGVPSTFFFEDGFQDVAMINGLNAGCWFGVGIDPSFYWFTIEAQAAGPLGFIFQSGDIPSDIDFNVWGPFTPEQVCETPQQIVNFVTNNQPIRSSYDGGTEPTGLADIHPAFGYAVLDTYDCQGVADDVVSAIQCQPGEVYVVLVNDWGNQIVNGGIEVDWGPSNPAVLAPVAIEVVAGDTAVCSGETVQIILNSSIENITWIDPSGTLSCDDCIDPFATPVETTVYKALIDAVCYMDTIEITVEVFDLELGPNQTVCRGEEFVVVGGDDFATATYQWTPPAGLTFSCTDCATPTVLAQQPGVYQVPAVLTAADCQFFDTLTVTVLQQEAPEVTVLSDIQICAGQTVNLGGPQEAGVTYIWTSQPVGFTSSSANPAVSPTATTTYFLNTTNGLCPFPSRDSVTVSVVQLPIVSAITNTTICQGDSIQLSTLTPEAGVSYLWTGGQGLTDATDPNTFVTPTASAVYTLTADRLGCSVQASVNLTLTQIAVDLLNNDTTRICQGETVNIQTQVSPANQPVIWNQPNLSGTNFTVAPVGTTLYTATVNVGSCFRADTILIQVDSIPADLGFTLEPLKDVYCFGEQVIISSPIYDPAEYPDIEHLWLQAVGALTPDSLYNLVFSTTDTAYYERVTIHRGCIDTTRILINVIEPILPRIVPADTSICVGQSVSLQVLHTNRDRVTYEWEPATGLSCTDCPNPVATPPTSTTYKVQTEIDGECPESAVANITIRPLPAFNLVPPPIICLGESTTLFAGTPEPDATYLWTAPSIPGFSSADPFASLSPTTTTTYVLTATNACGASSREIMVVVIGDTELEILGDLTICTTESTNLFVETVPALPASVLANTVWTWPGGTQTGSTITVSPDTSTTYTATLSLEDCGEITATATVTVLEAPTALLETERDTVYSLGPVVVTATTEPATGNTFVWSPAPDSQSGNTFFFTAQETQDTAGVTQLFSLTLTTAEGCILNTGVVIVVRAPQADIPNIFSPNGDMRNDLFKIFNADELEDIEMMVYNRWGQLVYEASNNNGWNGTYKGDPAPADVYIYRVKFKIGGEIIEKTGELTLVR